VSHTAAQIIAAYGAVDVEGGYWPSLLPTLLNNISNPEIPMKPKVSSLEVRTYVRTLMADLRPIDSTTADRCI
jgi:hypothetical protein